MTQINFAQAIELATKMFKAGNPAGARELCTQLLRGLPTFAPALHLLAVMELDTGDLANAEAHFRAAIAAAPQIAEYRNNFAILLWNTGRMDAAADELTAATQLDPNYAAGFANLAALQGEMGNLTASVELNQKAVAMQASGGSLNNLAGALMRSGRVRESIETYRKAADLEPDHPHARSNVLLVSHYDPELSPREIFEKHVAWGKRIGELIPAITQHSNDRNPDRRLRIGYLSNDFRLHSVAFFLMPILQRHDRTQVEVFCYSTVPKEDEMGRRARSHADHWRAVVGLPDPKIAEIIRSDAIDILVDLSTHTSNNRLPVLARKPAPIQVGYLGYPNTSGLATIDYRLTDSLADPLGESDELNTEKLVRIDPCAWCYEPYPRSPQVAPPPSERGAPITFGSFNALAKINDRVIEVWAKLLHEVPGSRLAIKSGAFADPPNKVRIANQFSLHGIPAERLELRGHFVDPAEHLGAYAFLDVALDTFPYNGTTTTCEALWMGVPVVTLAGHAHAGRVGTSLLTAVELDELIANDAQEYVAIAARLARSKVKLKKLRAGMRKRLVGSPLLDGAGMAKRIDAAYRSMWRDWCAANR